MLSARILFRDVREQIFRTKFLPFSDFIPIPFPFPSDTNPIHIFPAEQFPIPSYSRSHLTNQPRRMGICEECFLQACAINQQ